jgi:tellurite methyltransferase
MGEERSADRAQAAAGAGIPPGARFWEDSFRAHDAGWFFGGEPSTLARRFLHFLRLMGMPMQGRLLDIGCGEGRDVVLLASVGFEVDAVDGAPTGVQRAREGLSRAGLRGQVWQGDLGEIDWKRDYDVILANQSVQFVGDQALRVLDEIRRHTKPDGWNVIGMFTREEYDWKQEKDVYCLDQRELKHIYRGWRIFEYTESVVWSPRREDYLSFANLIARKPSS